METRINRMSEHKATPLWGGAGKGLTGARCGLGACRRLPHLGWLGGARVTPAWPPPKCTWSQQGGHQGGGGAAPWSYRPPAVCLALPQWSHQASDGPRHSTSHDVFQLPSTPTVSSVGTGTICQGLGRGRQSGHCCLSCCLVINSSPTERVTIPSPSGTLCVLLRRPVSPPASVPGCAPAGGRRPSASGLSGVQDACV